MRALFIFIISFNSSMILVNFIKKIGIKFSLLDKPDAARKKNYSAKVRIGGLATFLSILISIFIVSFLKIFKINYLDFELNYYLMISICFYFFIGFYEDIRGITAFKRLIMQIAFSTYIWKFGFRIETINLLGILNENLIFELNNYTSLIFTILWVTGLVNAINWIDGLDGLASGLSIVILLSISYVCFQNNFVSEGILSLIIAGSSLGFLMYNYYPSSILMGDGGSYMLGSSIAFLSLIATSHINQSSDLPFTSNIDLIVIYPILFLPLTDMTYVILKRLFTGSSIFSPDRNHFHYFLFDNGLGHEETVRIVISISILFASIGLLFFTNNPLIIVIPLINIIYQLYKLKITNLL